MQVNSLNSYTSFNQKNNNFGLNFSDAKDKFEKGEIHNMDSLIDYAYEKSSDALSNEERNKYAAIGFQLFSATINQSLNEAMKKQGVNNISNFNTKGWKQSRDEILQE